MDSRMSGILIYFSIHSFLDVGEMDIAFLFVREPPLVWEIQTFSYWFGTRFDFIWISKNCQNKLLKIYVEGLESAVSVYLSFFLLCNLLELETHL